MDGPIVHSLHFSCKQFVDSEDLGRSGEIRDRSTIDGDARLLHLKRILPYYTVRSMPWIDPFLQVQEASAESR